MSPQRRAWKLHLPPLPERLRRRFRRKSRDASAEEPEPPRYRNDDTRLRVAWRRLRYLGERYSLLRDVVGALLLVAVVTGGIATITGGVWPPVLAVESGSMMHGEYETPYGRIGTIDVGDLVFVRGVDGPDDIALWVDGGEHRYGRPGDVIAFLQDGDRGPDNMTILHRAITFVNRTRDSEGILSYSFRWVDGKTLTFGPQGIYFPPLGFDESRGFTRTNGYRPEYSGYITKGDNALTNNIADQAAGLTKLVHPEWVVGEIYGEVPWLGLVKLASQNGRTNPFVPGWERFGNAYAPIEIWTMFFLVLAIVVLIPFAIGTWRLWRAERVRWDRVTQRVPDYVQRPRAPPPAPRPAAKTTLVVVKRDTAGGPESRR